MHSAKQHNQQKCHHARSTQTMMRNTMARNVLTALAATAFALTAFSVSAAPIYWADWTTGQTTGAGFQAQGVITTPSSTINVTYTNPQGHHRPYQGRYPDVDLLASRRQPGVLLRQSQRQWLRL